jgi:hypothetical protein
MNISSRFARRTLIAFSTSLALTSFAAGRLVDSLPLASLVPYSQEVLEKIDSAQTDAVWDQGSSVFRDATSKNDFTANVAAARSGMGAVAERSWQLISRDRFESGNDKKLPPGDYATINYLVRDDRGNEFRELVSFRFEKDRQWRLAGYVTRKVPSK